MIERSWQKLRKLKAGAFINTGTGWQDADVGDGYASPIAFVMEITEAIH
jgi:hypothetical protein